jgi:hypothetical protein
VPTQEPDPTSRPDDGASAAAAAQRAEPVAPAAPAPTEVFPPQPAAPPAEGDVADFQAAWSSSLLTRGPRLRVPWKGLRTLGAVGLSLLAVGGIVLVADQLPKFSTVSATATSTTSPSTRTTTTTTATVAAGPTPTPSATPATPTVQAPPVAPPAGGGGGSGSGGSQEQVTTTRPASRPKVTTQAAAKAATRTTTAATQAKATGPVLVTGPNAVVTKASVLRNVGNGLLAVEEDEYVGDTAFGMIRARSDTADSWEAFSFEYHSDRKAWAIKSRQNGRYLAAELDFPEGNYGMLRARSTSVGTWELFQIFKQPDGAYALRNVANSRWVTAELEYGEGGYAMLRARSTTIGSWEKFGIS